MFIKIAIAIGISILLVVFYTQLYYRRVNKVIEKTHTKLYKIKPGTFSLVVLFICSLSIMTLSFTEVVALENEVVTLKDRNIVNVYQHGNFPNETIQNTYNKYINHFAGYYITNGQYILCITMDSPEELENYLIENGQSYVKVKYSYCELLLLTDVIMENAQIPEFVCVGIDVEKNHVYLGVLNESFDSSMFSYYIENEMIKVEVVPPNELY
jgi:hypothetical protein